MSILNFSNIEKAEEMLNLTWNEFTIALANNKFKYNEINKAINMTFLKVFDNLFQNTYIKETISSTLKELKNNDIDLCRAVKLNAHEELTYKRFLPNSKYIKEDNRFSPKDIEWLYVAIDTKSKVKNQLTDIELCCINECRIEDNDRVGLCHLTFKEKYLDKKIIDLTISNNISYNKINNSLIKAEKTYYLNINKNFIIKEITKWIIYTYTKLLSEQIFKPVSKDKSLKYAPFQCMAQYFIEKNYNGIIYNSTVHNKAKNLVLFNKDYVEQVGEISDFIYETNL